MGMFFGSDEAGYNYDEFRDDDLLMHQIKESKYKDRSLFSKIEDREITNEDIDAFLAEEMS